MRGLRSDETRRADGESCSPKRRAVTGSATQSIQDVSTAQASMIRGRARIKALGAWRRSTGTATRATALQTQRAKADASKLSRAENRSARARPS
jgi:hypothetical protein